MIKKVYYWVFTIPQVLFFIIAFGIQVLSAKKMGAMRYVVYINHQWEAQYPIVTLRYIAIAFLAVLSVAIVLYALTKKDNYIMSKKTLPMLIVEVIITLSFVLFTLSYSTESYRSYYFTGLILAINALIQDIKIIVYLKSNDCRGSFIF